MNKIKDLPEFSKPREKLKEKGIISLTDIELIALILGRGTKNQDVLKISSKISKLIELKGDRIDLESLLSIPGIGFAKAAQIQALFELARRHIKKDTIKISEAKDVLPLLSDITSKQQEYFICISLNGANEVIEKRIVTVGLLNKTQVHPREVYADVISDRAASVIFAHNHPSGELKPSDADIKMHTQLVEAGKILGINVLDHIIITKSGYYSFQEDNECL